MTDTSATKIFVGGLAWGTTSDTLREYFAKFGDIVEAVVIIDKQRQRSKGYGFVTYVEADAANAAVAEPNPVIDGRRTNCNLAALGAKKRTPYMHGPPAYYPPMDVAYQAPIGAGQGAFVHGGYGGFGAPNMNPGSPFFPMPMMFPPYAGDGTMDGSQNGAPQQNGDGHNSSNGSSANNANNNNNNNNTNTNGYDAMMHQQQMYMQMMMQMQMQQAQQQQQHGNGYQTFGGGAPYMGMTGGEQGGYQQGGFNYGPGAQQQPVGGDETCSSGQGAAAATGDGGE